AAVPETAAGWASVGPPSEGGQRKAESSAERAPHGSERVACGGERRGSPQRNKRSDAEQECGN
ncbi:MAG: hypothetical protein AAF480_19625, partial [Actinomycetota bacterium]